MSALPAQSFHLHGTLMKVAGVGVLLTGGEGVGKSRLALELLARNHCLVADDAPEFSMMAEGRLIGRCPGPLRGFLNVRGLGVLGVPQLFGPAATCESVALELILQLEGSLDGIESSDLNASRSLRTLGAIEIPVQHLLVPGNPAVVSMAEAACRDFHVRRQGYDATTDFLGRQARAMEASR